MSKELDYITELERENRLLGERCNQLLKDKGELTDKIADIKANCDLAIEGRDIKIKELETENAELKEKIEVLECDNYNANCNLNLITDHLTKARGLLTKWVELYKPKLECYPITPIQEQTEQFLGVEPIDEEKDAWQKYYDFGRQKNERRRNGR